MPTAFKVAVAARQRIIDDEGEAERLVLNVHEQVLTLRLLHRYDTHPVVRATIWCEADLAAALSQARLASERADQDVEQAATAERASRCRDYDARLASLDTDAVQQQLDVNMDDEGNDASAEPSSSDDGAASSDYEEKQGSSPPVRTPCTRSGGGGSLPRPLSLTGGAEYARSLPPQESEDGGTGSIKTTRRLTSDSTDSDTGSAENMRPLTSESEEGYPN